MKHILLAFWSRAFPFLALCALLLAMGCPPPGPPSPVPPDADAAPSPPVVVDAAPMPVDASSTCQAACGNLTLLCGPQHPDCPAVLQLVNDKSTKRIPCGQTLCPALTCRDLVAASTVAAIKALGVGCP